MAYTPINWQTGDTITAEKLNRCDNGWGVTETQLFSETVTTSADPEYPEDGAMGTLVYVFQEEPPSVATITFDGTDYVCQRTESYGYGNSDGSYSDFPFYISPEESLTRIFTQLSGTHSVSLAVTSVETSSAFGAAVNSCVEAPSVPFLQIEVSDGATDFSWQEIYDAFTNGHVCVVSSYGPVLQMWYGNGDRYYMATGSTNPQNGKFDPAIWRTPGTSSDLGMSFYMYNSQM